MGIAAIETVIPAQGGILKPVQKGRGLWIPACAGMTVVRAGVTVRGREGRQEIRQEYAIAPGSGQGGYGFDFH